MFNSHSILRNDFQSLLLYSSTPLHLAGKYWTFDFQLNWTFRQVIYNKNQVINWLDLCKAMTHYRQWGDCISSKVAYFLIIVLAISQKKQQQQQKNTIILISGLKVSQADNESISRVIRVAVFCSLPYIRIKLQLMTLPLRNRQELRHWAWVCLAEVYSRIKLPLFIPAVTTGRGRINHNRNVGDYYFKERDVFTEPNAYLPWRR